jgi:hypothetical protein
MPQRMSSGHGSSIGACLERCKFRKVLVKDKRPIMAGRICMSYKGTRLIQKDKKEEQKHSRTNSFCLA